MILTRTTLLALMSSLFVLSAGCANDDDDDDNNRQTEQQQPANPNAQRITELKTQIRQIAEEPTDRFDSDDNKAEVALRLHPLVAELQSLRQKRNLQDLQAQLLGPWRQVWSNMKVSPGGQGPLADHVYQVILANNVLWNIALSEEQGTQQTIMLRGGYQLPDEDGLVFTYDKAVFQPIFSTQGTDLNTLAMQAENGAFNANVKTFPDGMNPLGKRGELEELYVDGDIRVSRSGLQLFVFERAQTIGAPAPQ